MLCIVINYFTKIYESFTGVSHGDDTMYVIKTKYGNPHDNAEDAKLIPVMVNIWSSFAKTGYVKVNVIFLNKKNNN